MKSLLPLDELHSRGKCAYCGTTRARLVRTVLVSTEAIAEICADRVGCIRRRRRQKQ